MRRAAYVLALLCLAGCSRSPVAPLRVPASAEIIGGQKGKDATVLAEADKIDAITPDAKPHTDAQRAAVAAAPAADVEKLDAQWKAVVAQLTKERDEARRERDEARNATDKAIIIGGYALAAILLALGVASFFLAAQVPLLGPRISIALIAAAASVFGMLQAYQWTKAHPWITGITGLLLLVSGVLAYSNHLHHKESPK